MARVNHKLVKQRLNEKRSKITDKQFFSSRMLAGHFEDLAAAQTRRYHYNRRVRVNLYWKPKDAFTAATDNMQIRINTGHPLVTKVKGRENRYQLVCGMFAHELGHVLFTDFLSAQTYQTGSLPIPVTTARPLRRICAESSRNINAKACSLLPLQSATISRILRESTEIPSSILLT